MKAKKANYETAKRIYHCLLKSDSTEQKSMTQ